MGTYIPPLPPQNFQAKVANPPVKAIWLNAVDQLLQGNVPATGTYSGQFLSGAIQLTGPNGIMTSYGDLGFSLASPGSLGVGPFLRVAGAGKTFGQIGTDAQVAGQNGINLSISAGDAAAGDLHAGGNLFLYAGGSGPGLGGNATLQGGTSALGNAGHVYVQGGNAVAGIAGNLYLSGGLTGPLGGGSVHLVMTDTANGVSVGSIVFRVNSTILWTITSSGALFLGASGAGLPGYVLVSGGPNALPNWSPSTGALLYPQTRNEQTQNVIPVNFSYPPGDARRYGADPAGILDATQALNNALLTNGRVYVPSGNYTCSGTLNLASNQVLYGDGSSTVLTWANPSISNIVGSGISNTTINDLKINVTGAGNNSIAVGGVVLANNSKFCKVARLEITGVNWSGVWIQGSSNNSVRDCYFHNFTGTQPNTSDVIVTNDGGGVNLCDYNIVDGNQCFGGGYFGVTFQQFYGTDTITPRYNIASNNRIGQHTAYGILFYNVVSFTDTFNQAVDNYIENIQGSVISNNSGAGIYGASQGGLQIIGNTIRNCCVQTVNATLTPAAIGLNGVGGAGQSPFLISDNHIENMPNFRGVEVASWTLGGVIDGNVISFAVGGVPDFAILVQNCSNVTVSNNDINVNINIAGTRGIYVLAASLTVANINLNGNTINGCAFRQISVEGTGGFNVQNLSVSGNSLVGGGTTCIPMQLLAVQGASVNGNMASVSTLNALNINGCTGVRITGGYWSTIGTTAVSLTGTNTGGYFDKSNFVSTAIANSGTGMIVEQLGSAPPGGGTAALGDRIEQSIPVLGNPKGWRCTAAGSPGTWTSEGNL